MDNWDSEASDDTPTPSIPSVKTASKWEGEDVEEDVMESWDQEPEEGDQTPKVAPSPIPATATKKNKKVGERYEEKEKKKAELAKLKDSKPMTAEEILADKLNRQKLQEEADLTLAKEVFGVIGSTTVLESKEDYDKFREDILKVVADCIKNAQFVNFTEELVHSLCIHLSSADIKKIYSWLGNLHIEKSKIEKGEKSKKSKGKGKAKLKLEGDNDYSEYSAYTEDFDDFI